MINSTPVVTIIEPTKQIIRGQSVDINNVQKKKVAAYARVSTEQDEQQSSYEAQVTFYSNYITQNPNWEFVKIYADEGITGTNTKKREGFKEMIDDAMNGNIDLILTKSISRFARNTVDTLSTIRQLSYKGIEVYFEKENIHTLDPACEVMLTIFSSLAQEESRSISENVRWGKIHSMQSGKVSMAYKTFLGYEKGPDGKPKIVESEAKIIREIYDMFIDGYSINQISNILKQKGYVTKRGSHAWEPHTIISILTNEKYKGDALLQKTYVRDYLTKKVCKNNGELPQYYISHSHDAIIDPSIFDMVQHEYAKRQNIGRRYSNQSVLASKLICADCGEFYGHKIHRTTPMHIQDNWYCNNRYIGDRTCRTPILHEEEIKDAYLKAWSKIIDNKEEISSVISQKIRSTEALIDEDKDLETTLENRLTELASESEKLSVKLEYGSNEILIEKQTYVSKQIVKQKEMLEAVKNNILDNITKKVKMERFSAFLASHAEKTQTHSDEYWMKTIEKVIVGRNKQLDFHFKDGSIIQINL